MKKVILWILVLISIIFLLIRYSSQITEIVFGTKQISGISVMSTPDGATVFLDNKEVGKTPFDNKDLEVKEYAVRLEKDGAFWQGKVKLSPQTIAIVNRDLAANQASSSGEILTLERGRGLTVISNPSDSDVEIDGKSFGKTPLEINTTSGEHTVVVSHQNYLERSIRIDLPANFNLTLSVDLALSEADLSTVATPVIIQTLQVKVLPTPTGFLRVRDKPSLSGSEIARVNSGDILIFLDEQGGWTRVKLADGTIGFVSSVYVEKSLPQAPK